jgi:hypothetical protein
MIDETKLEKVKRKGDGRIIARCPACAEDGSDKSGNHLFIGADGKFGCVLYPKEQGEDHRKRIFALAGIKSGTLGTPISNPRAYAGKKTISIRIRSFKMPSQPSHAFKCYNAHGQEIDAETGFPIINGAICPF